MPRKDLNKAKPKARDRRSFADPDLRMMKSSDKAFIQGYVSQAAVDAEIQIIVAADLANQAGDYPCLRDQVEQVKCNTGKKPREVSVDAGYFSEDDVQYLEGHGITALIRLDKIKRSEWRVQKPPRGRIPKNMTLKDRMPRRLRTMPGREWFKLRQTLVEPTFGRITEPIGLRRFTCALRNILKLFTAAVRLHRPLRRRRAGSQPNSLQVLPIEFIIRYPRALVRNLCGCYSYGLLEHPDR